MMADKRKKPSCNKGRQKIDIKRIHRESSRQTTFSKRRVGLFNKASELCLLCGAEAAILAFSPAGNKLYSFANPSVDSVVERFIRGGVEPKPADDDDHHEEEEACRVGELKQQYLEVLSQLEAEKNRSHEEDVIIKKSSLADQAKLQQQLDKEAAPWWEAPIDDGMGLIELRQLKMRMEELQKYVAKRADELMTAKRADELMTAKQAAVVPRHGHEHGNEGPYHGFSFESTPWR